MIEEMKKKHRKARIAYFKCDISVKDEVEATFNSVESMFQTVDIIINSAGILNDKKMELTFKVNVVRVLIFLTFYSTEMKSQ